MRRLGIRRAWSAQVAGDYAIGSNHVLPTAGAARVRGGLSAADFVRQITVQRLTQRGCAALVQAVVALARAEGLEGHARSIEIRVRGRFREADPSARFIMLIQGYPDPGEGLRLHLNENTGGCSPRVLEAIRRAADRPTSSTYPSYPSAGADDAPRHFDVDPEWVLLTNGLDEGILMAAVGHIARRRASTTPRRSCRLPAFDPYPNSTAAVGATAVRVPPDRTSRFRQMPSSRAITPQTRMIFLNTPNNPTGQLIPIDDLTRIARRAGHAIVLIDEAYIEFGGESFLPELPRYPERAGRPHVLEGLRPRGHARRHRHRSAAGARAGARRHAAVQHQRASR